MRLPALALALLLPTTAAAEPLTIAILSAATSTYVRNWETDGPDVDREQTGSGALADTLIGASAAADYFNVFAATTSYATGDIFTTTGKSLAIATSVTEFQPLYDGMAALTLTLLTGTSSSMWSEGSVQLTNLTTGEQLFDYGWDSVLPGHFIWSPVTYGADLLHSALYNTPTTLALALSTESLYRLTLRTQTQAAGDHQMIDLRVDGLHTVPEPATMAIVLIGGAVGYTARRRALTARHSAAPSCRVAREAIQCDLS